MSVQVLDGTQLLTLKLPPPRKTAFVLTALPQQLSKCPLPALKVDDGESLPAVELEILALSLITISS